MLGDFVRQTRTTLRVWNHQSSHLCSPLPILLKAIINWTDNERGLVIHHRCQTKGHVVASLLTECWWAADLRQVTVCVTVSLAWSLCIRSLLLQHMCLLGKMRTPEISQVDLLLCILMRGPGFQLCISRRIQGRDTDATKIGYILQRTVISFFFKYFNFVCSFTNILLNG